MQLYFRFFTDDWIITGGKHWLFSFLKEPCLLLKKFKFLKLLLLVIQIRVEQNTSKSMVGLGHSIKVTDTENQYKVGHHTFGSFLGKSPKQDELILSEPKMQ